MGGIDCFVNIEMLGILFVFWVVVFLVGLLMLLVIDIGVNRRCLFISVVLFCFVFVVLFSSCFGKDGFGLFIILDNIWCGLIYELDWWNFIFIWGMFGLLFFIINLDVFGDFLSLLVLCVERIDELWD